MSESTTSEEGSERVIARQTNSSRNNWRRGVATMYERSLESLMKNAEAVSLQKAYRRQLTPRFSLIVRFENFSHCTFADPPSSVLFHIY